MHVSFDYCISLSYNAYSNQFTARAIRCGIQTLSRTTGGVLDMNNAAVRVVMATITIIGCSRKCQCFGGANALSDTGISRYRAFVVHVTMCHVSMSSRQLLDDPI